VAVVTPSPIPIVALDVANAGTALQMVDELRSLCSFFKIGSELYSAEGPSVVRAVQAKGADVFLDLKFHDIPNTVRGAVRSAAGLGVRLLTVHAVGGRPMMEAAVAGVRDVAAECGVLAVTILTSLDRSLLGSVWGRPVDDVEVEVLRLAEVAAESGVHGVVCSGQEAAGVRARLGERIVTLVPGVRLTGGDHQDQARVVTPGQAARAGARYIVIGRAVTGAKSPRDAMAEVLADLS
jgi:orotidine-5'-phosphate decarboxylase